MAFQIGFTPQAQKVLASFDAHMLVVGQSGGGKSVLLRNIILAGANDEGASTQFIVLDPKMVSFIGWDKRCHIFSRPEMYLQVLTSLENEMLRRYQKMVDLGVPSLDMTEETPRIVLVIDELNAFVQSQDTADKTKEMNRLLMSLGNQARQANIALVLCGQSVGSEVIPTQLRAACAQRLILKLQGEEQITMASGGRNEECKASLLNLPGEMYALTTETLGNFVRCRTIARSHGDEQALIERLSQDKRSLDCLDWDNPEFLG